MIESLVRFALLGNATLLVAYVGFAITRRWLLLKHLATERQRLRLAQFAFGAAIACPLIVALLPSQPMPRLERTLRAPFTEFAAPTRRPIVAPASEKASNRKAPLLRDTFDWKAALPPILLGAILLTTLLRLAWLARERWRLRRILASGIPFRNLGTVRIALSEAVSIPFAARAHGIRWVVLPCSLVENWNDFRLALKHELQHHRQNDPIWSMAIELVGSFFVLNPAMTAWKRTIAELQEFSCDEALLGRRRVAVREYASCLFRVAEAALGSGKVPAGTAGMAQLTGNPKQNRSFLRRRIEMLMDKQPKRRYHALKWLGTGLALSTFTVALASKVATTHSDDAIRSGVAQVDPEVQKIADRAVSKAVERHNAQAAFAIVADPATGRVLAVSNIDKVNRVTSQWSLSFRMEPASVFKTLIAAAALENGKTQPDTVHDCENGKYLLGGREYRDWKPFGKLTTSQTVEQSSNICGIKIAQKVGADALLTALKKYGFGSSGAASDFPGARPGRLPEAGELTAEEFVATLGTGYEGLTITPLEMISAYSAIANGGYVLKPQQASAPAHSRIVVRRAFSEETAAQVRRILTSSIEKGTGLNAKSARYRFGGKTGTTYHPAFHGNPTLGGTANVSTFMGLAPAESAKLVIYVSVFEPKPDAHGSTQAAPLFKEIAENVLQHWKFEADPS